MVLNWYIYIYIVPHPQTCAQTLSLIPSLKMSCHNGAAAEILTSQGPSQICWIDVSSRKLATYPHWSSAEQRGQSSALPINQKGKGETYAAPLHHLPKMWKLARNMPHSTVTSQQLTRELKGSLFGCMKLFRAKETELAIDSSMLGVSSDTLRACPTAPCLNINKSTHPK